MKKLSIKKEIIAELELKGDIIGGYTGFESCTPCFFTQQLGCVSDVYYC